MGRSLRLVVVAVFVAAVVFPGLGSSDRAAACSCAPASPEELISGASAVVVGTFGKPITSADGATGNEFEWQLAWRAKPEQPLPIWTSLGSCSVEFASGTDYALGIHRDRFGDARVAQCSYIRPIHGEQLPPELVLLGEPEFVAGASREVATATPPDHGRDWTAAGLVALVGVVSAGALLVVGLRSRRST